LAGTEGAEDAADLLRELEERLERASAAAERLAAEAAQAAATRLGGAPRPPAAGWQPASGDGARRPAQEDLDALLHLLRGLGEAIPPELRRALAEALRELLHALRALVDWCLERIEQRGRDEPEVQDIPIL
jgi:hypothetical protein